MKREYSYGSVILVEIIIAVLAFGLYMAFGDKANESIIYSIFSSIITWLGSFIIASALINNRKGSIGDYLNQIGRLDKKAIIVNLLLIAITVLLTEAFGKAKDLVKIAKIIDKKAKKNLVMIMVSKILLMILSLLGYGPIWLSVVGDVGILIFTIISSVNILKKKI